MVLDLLKIKSFIWFLIISTLVLSFPLQVLFSSPLPSLLPYFLIGLVLFITFLFHGKTISENIKLFFSLQFTKTEFGILIYFVLFITNTAWQTLFGFVTLYEALSSFVIYILPTIFYFYFRQLADLNEIKWVIKTMAITGFFVGLFFVYDSYSKMQLERVTDYALMAFNYSLERSNYTIAQANIARINIGSRSYGLLQTHSISGAWTLIGLLSTLFLIPRAQKLLRIVTILVFGLFLFLALNFTSIFSFLFIMFFWEFDGFELFKKLNVRSLLRMSCFIILGAILVFVSFQLAGDVMATSMIKKITWQLHFLFGTGGSDHVSKLGGIIETLGRYVEHVIHYPLTVFLGDGFSRFGMEKGGDIGFIDTIAQLGLLFYIFIICSFIFLFKKNFTLLLSKNENDSIRLVQFSLAIIFYITLADIHYSIWISKSILPIIFISLALLERYRNLTADLLKSNQI